MILISLLVLLQVSPTESAPPGWIPVEDHQRNQTIPWNFDETPLLIKTNSTAGSNDRINIFLWENGFSRSRRISINFKSEIVYKLSYCTDQYSAFPIPPPEEVEKIWTITKTHDHLTISCNGVHLLTYTFSESNEYCTLSGSHLDCNFTTPLCASTAPSSTDECTRWTECNSRWSGGIVSGITFSFDNATSHYYNYNYYSGTWRYHMEPSRSDDPNIPIYWDRTMSRQVAIDLERLPLLIKTNLQLPRSGEYIWIYRDKTEWEQGHGKWLGDIRIQFYITHIEIWAIGCSILRPVLIDYPSNETQEIIWIISKTTEFLSISSNGVTHLTYTFSNGTASGKRFGPQRLSEKQYDWEKCASRLRGDVVDRVVVYATNGEYIHYRKPTDWTWTPIRRDVKVPWGEGIYGYYRGYTPGHHTITIWTNSTMGSGAYVDIRLYNERRGYIGRIQLKFAAKMKYRISFCLNRFKTLPVQPPPEVEKMWSITKNYHSHMSIWCNGVELLRFNFYRSEFVREDSTVRVDSAVEKEKCGRQWAAKLVDYIKFTRHDTASIYSRR